MRVLECTQCKQRTEVKGVQGRFPKQCKFCQASKSWHLLEVKT
jgi:hypothetical protein